MNREYDLIGGPVKRVKLPMHPTAGEVLIFPDREKARRAYMILNVGYGIVEDELNYGKPAIFVRNLEDMLND
jgi:hypothetical protein